MSSTRIGPYRIVRKLGEGGMGSVYEAVKDGKDGEERPVAIKVLRPEYARSQEFISRVFREARAINDVVHPGMVQIVDTGTQDGTAYIVMELLRGESLGNRIKRVAGPMVVQQVLAIAQHVASALTAAHEKGIVHRVL